MDGRGGRKPRRDCNADQAHPRRRAQTGSGTQDQAGPFAVGAESEGEMKERRVQLWTPAEDERLRKLAAEGRPSVTIAERLKRPPDSVRYRAAKLKIVLVRAKRK